MKNTINRGPSHRKENDFNEQTNVRRHKHSTIRKFGALHQERREVDQAVAHEGVGTRTELEDRNDQWVLLLAHPEE